MNAPDDLRYSTDHEWLRIGDDGLVRVGVTDYAQDALGDVVYVDLPTVGAEVASGDSVAEVESTKSVSDIYCPVDGIIVAVNEQLADAPEGMNHDPYGEGWIFEVQAAEGTDYSAFLDASAYISITEG
ncbi:MAG: glycine cleavage system protein GcvH [Acidimicrobiales bacterium]